MSQSDIDWWDVLEKGSEVVGILSTLGALASKKKEPAGVAAAALVARIICAVTAPPRCPACSRHMGKSQNAWVCPACGFIQLIADLAI